MRAIRRHWWVLLMGLPWLGFAGAAFEGGAVEELFETPARGTLIIEGEFFSLDVRGYHGDQVAGRAVMSARVHERNGVRLAVEHAGDQLTVRVVTNDLDVLPSALRWYPLIALRVPHGVALQATAAGDIIVEDLRAARTDLYTFAGDIVVRDVSGELLTTNALGTTRVSGSTGPKWLVSSAGDIHVEHSRGDIRLQTVSGAVALREVTGDVVTNVPDDELQVAGLQGVITVAVEPVTGARN